MLEYGQKMRILTTEQSRLLFETILRQRARPGLCLCHLRDFQSRCVASCYCRRYCSPVDLGQTGGTRGLI